MEENEELNEQLNSETNEELTPEFASRLNVSALQPKLDALRMEIRKVIVGQEQLLDLLLVSILANGNVLIEGVPGVAKTLMAKLVAKCINSEFKRIQFTPDLMPSDILGTSIFDPKTVSFEFKKGPIFSNIVLIDEINRAPAKTQAALFEVMEERQITIDNNAYKMAEPFLIFATQNPIEQEGTYRLPEAQMDRFLFKINVDYPKLEDEIEILQQEHVSTDRTKLKDVQAILSSEDILELQQVTRGVIVEDKLIEYIAKIIVQTRENNSIYIGASPRASISLLNASKAFALISGRDFVTPEDIKEIAFSVLNHRITITPEKEMEGIQLSSILTQIIDSIEVPR
jgi:MoxR-like ATPase